MNNQVVVKVKDLPIKIEKSIFKGDDGAEREYYKFFVNVNVDGETERVDLRTENGLKRRLIVKNILSGVPTILKVKERTFEDKKDGKKIKYVLFYTPIRVSGIDAEVRFTIDTGKDKTADIRLERALILQGLGLTLDSEAGLREEDLPF